MKPLEEIIKARIKSTTVDKEYLAKIGQVKPLEIYLVPCRGIRLDYSSYNYPKAAEIHFHIFNNENFKKWEVASYPFLVMWKPDRVPYHPPCLPWVISAPDFLLNTLKVNIKSFSYDTGLGKFLFQAIFYGLEINFERGYIKSNIPFSDDIKMMKEELRKRLENMFADEELFQAMEVVEDDELSDIHRAINGEELRIKTISKNLKITLREMLPLINDLNTRSIYTSKLGFPVIEDENT